MVADIAEQHGKEAFQRCARPVGVGVGAGGLNRHPTIWKGGTEPPIQTRIGVEGLVIRV